MKKLLQKLNKKLFKDPINKKIVLIFFILAIAEILIAYKPITKQFSRDTLDVLIVLEMIITPITVIILSLFTIEKLKKQLSKKAFLIGYFTALLPALIIIIFKFNSVPILENFYEKISYILGYPVSFIVYLLGWHGWNNVWVSIPLIILIVFPLLTGILTTVIYSLFRKNKS